MEASRTDNVTVDVTPGKVCEAKFGGGKRTVLFLTNVSTGGQVISLAVGSEAILNKGIVLNPGGFYSESTDNRFTCTQESITAISDIAGAILAIHERINYDGI